MQIRMRFFAFLRERAGAERESFEVASGTTAGSAFALRFPDLALRVGYARNGEICGPETELLDGDELALLPPIGGG